MTKPVIVIDTDIGTDSDDAFAIAYALRNPEAEVKAIVTVQENKGLRAKIARKLIRIVGREVPIISGAEGEEKWRCGFEHLALSEKELSEPLKETPAIEYAKGDVLVGIGPLTNIAKQLRDNPTIKNVSEIYLMGSHEGSHNFKVDLGATREVLAHEWKKYFVTKDVSENIYFSRDKVYSLKGSNIGDFLADSTIRWLDFTRRCRATMYDVLAVSAALGEDYVKFRKSGKNKFVSYGVDSELEDKIMEAAR